MAKDGMPTLSYYSSAESLMNESERKDAVAALKSLMVKLRDIPGTYAQFADIKEPLPVKLSLILRFLAETCKQLIALENENSESNEAVMSAKQLCAAARIVRQILHVQQVSDYRALGLNDGATQEQIHKHYRWLSSLFAFDEGIDPERHSTRRTMQAYISLKDSGSSLEDGHVLSGSVSVKGAQQRDSLNSDTTLDTNERLAASDPVSDADEKTVVAPTVTLDSKKKKRSGMGIAASVLIFLTVASGVGWWWLLSGHDVDNIEAATSLKDWVPSQNESQKPQDIDIFEGGLTNEPESVKEEQSDRQKETNAEAPQQSVQAAILSAELDEEISISEPGTIRPSVPVVPISNPSEEVTEKTPVVITANKIPSQTKRTEKENIKIAKPESEKVAESELAISAPEIQGTVQSELPPAQVDNLVSQEDEMETLTDDLVEIAAELANLENEKIKVLSDAPVDNVISSAPSAALNTPPVSDKNTVQPTRFAAVDNSASQSLENLLEDVIVVIGSQDLEMSSLNVEQVTNIFLGEMTRLPGGQIIEVFDQEDGSTIKRDFYESVMGKTSRQIKAHWSILQFKGFVDLVHPPEALKNDKSTKKRVAATQFAIGYINGSALDDSVKVLHIVK